ncbi:Asp23/Gls24 family envelope stress response protein [Pseudarthrobacter sp. PS3-L1]|uniref:Asp23/Gls24 family envelope stress response protein n=1 Tax=Pseudarthrobacter sp. PS3-L1 TaxID=3046207 RepID=UPI0024B879B5|nr:Asp23/Gls24 family envelope stress response protein [Pseudarthrobacter sp. PS3-L1]MDJ0320822.1 Asp23/Gls24 family envelope stress response protein [Pseudarthrobacter sp. PS3-L1]
MTSQPQSTSSTTEHPTTATPTDVAKIQSSDKPGERGQTTVVDSVVAKVAGIATQNIPGVYALGGGATRALGAVREAVGQKDLAQGISVEVGQTQVAVDVTLVAEYPHPLQKVADDVRSAIFESIEGLVGMEVTEVNITITDIHIPSADDDKDDEKEEAPKEARVS